MLQATWKKNDKKATVLIVSFSTIVFAAILFLSRIKWNINLGFDPHLFAKANSIINSCVAILLIVALIAVKNKKYTLHKKIMLAAIFLSFLFLVSYICHHLFTGETRYGDINHDGLISDMEKQAVVSSRMFYYVILGTHIPLAGIILPFILFSAYQALIGDYGKHKKLVRIAWPVWFYVAVTGVIVYWMISPYYN
jgi:putative membrane protein